MNPLWTPTPHQIETSHLSHFLTFLHEKNGDSFKNYSDLYAWSVQDPQNFWRLFWDFSGIQAQQRGDVILEHPESMEKAHFFPQARLNYAENLLKEWIKSQKEGKPLDPIVIFWGEDQIRRTLSVQDFLHQITAIQGVLKKYGVGLGDRVAGFMPNIPESLMAMIATVSLGAIWTSCSPDFGITGILDRFGQIEPKVLFSADGYFYSGRWYSSLDKIRALYQKMPSVTHVIISPYDGRASKETLNNQEVSWQALTRETPPQNTLEFTQVPFNHPLFILYSSGTTGIPKCIIHGHGGTLIQHLKEHRLHCDIHSGDRVFYYTTCGWMMWNWLASTLASGATVMLYDGSPLFPDLETLFQYAEAEKITFLGVSAHYIDLLRKNKAQIRTQFNLHSLRMIASTGSPLSPESFDYVYESISKHICLASISGGTDIISCFALGNPTGPVWRGEIQARGLGLNVDVFDEEGKSLKGKKGELVCTAPFPSMPLGFWNDPEGRKYHEAYFDRFPNVWFHGDYVELTEHDGLIIHGRSDSILNPGGVRIGTAEIYRQVTSVDEVMECIAVGQEWADDIRIILFVHLKKGYQLTPDLIQKIKQQIRQNTTPRHVPALILEVQDIPKTLNGKLVERAVTEVIHGRPVKNKEALANPESLSLYEDLPELRAVASSTFTAQGSR